MIRKAIFPRCYLQGEDILKTLGDIPELKDRRLFILATDSAVRQIIPEHLSVWKEICTVDYERFNGQCTWEEIGQVIDLARPLAHDFVMGLGGGKVIDTARVAAHHLNAGYIAAPTIAATDAPTASACVVYDEKGRVKDYFTTRNPDHVLVDTRVIARAPVRFLVAGMGDALATWFEAETCDRCGFRNIAGGFNLRTVMAIARLCYQTLMEYGPDAKTACERGEVTPALEHVVEANTLMSGLGFESGGLSAAHGIHDCLCNLEQTHGYLHGEKVAFGTIAGLFLESRSLSLVPEVHGFCRSVGLPVTLEEIGLKDVTDKELGDAAAAVLQNKESYLHHMGFRLTPERIIEALRAADGVGAGK